MRPSLVAVFFMTYFYRARGAWPPWSPPPDPLLLLHYNDVMGSFMGGLGGSSQWLLLPFVPKFWERGRDLQMIFGLSVSAV